MGEEIADPVTLTTAAVIGSSALGAGASVIGGIQGQSAAEQQARAYRIQAGQEMVRAGNEVGRIDYQAGRAISEGRASAAASGLTQESIEPLVAENYGAAKTQEMFARYEGQLAAQNDLYKARLSKYEGRQQMLGGIFGGAESVLRGAMGVGAIRMAQSGSPNIGILAGSGIF